MYAQYCTSKRNIAQVNAYCTLIARIDAYCTLIAQVNAYCTLIARIDAYSTLIARIDAYCTLIARIDAASVAAFTAHIYCRVHPCLPMQQIYCRITYDRP